MLPGTLRLAEMIIGWQTRARSSFIGTRDRNTLLRLSKFS